MTINADNVTVVDCNVQSADGILINESADNTLISYVTCRTIGVSSAVGWTIEYTRIKLSLADSLHVTSDGSRMVTNGIVRHCLFDTPTPPTEAHWDGIQIRGINGFLMENTVIDAGPHQFPYNAAVYTEPANGGNSNMTFRNNWFYGGGYYCVHFGAASGTNSFTNNRLGGDLLPGGGWFRTDGVTSAHWQNTTGNVLDSTGAPLSVF
jgi:hypothetical protein